MRKSEERKREGERETREERQGRKKTRNKKTVEKGVASISGELVEEEQARYLFLFRG